MVLSIRVNGPWGYLQIGDTGRLRKAPFRSVGRVTTRPLQYQRFSGEVSSTSAAIVAFVALRRSIPAAHNLVPLRPTSRSSTTSEITTIREFTSQGCLHLVTCWCLFLWLMVGCRAGGAALQGTELISLLLPAELLLARRFRSLLPSVPAIVPGRFLCLALLSTS